MKRIIAFFLTLTLVFNINVKTIQADQVVHSDLDLVVEDVETYLLPVAIPTAQAVLYLLTALGVIGTSSAIYANKEAIEEWGTQQIEKFKVKALALGLTAELVDNWLEDLSNGVLVKSSEVWTAFKEWVKSLSDVGVIDPTIPYSGKVVAGQSFDIVTMVDGAKSNDGIDYYYDYYKFTAKADGYMVVAKWINNNPDSLYVVYAVPSTSRPSSTYSYEYKRPVDDSPKTGSSYIGSRDYFTVDGVKYWYSAAVWVSGTDTLPFFPNDFYTTALSKVIRGEYVPDVPVSNDYTIIGGVTDLDKVGIRNPGATEEQDVVIDWGNFDTVGVITGVGTGTITWDDALTQGGVVVTEDDVVIGGSDVVEEVPDVPVIEWPEVDLGGISDYTLDLTNIFPFCLPFDFIDFLNILSAEPETPYFEYDMPLPFGDSYKFVIDLSPFNDAAALMRKMETLAFIIGLVFITREKMIRG